MHKSIQDDLFALKKRLGPSPLEDAFQGLDHLRYRTAPGTAAALVLEIGARTGYRFSAAWRHRITGDHYYKLVLSGSPVALVVHEHAGAMAGYPRLDALAFRVTSLQPVLKLLQRERITFVEESWGAVTDPLPGLGDRFIYLPAGAPSWEASDELEPAAVDAAALQAAPFDDVRANIGAVDHIAYRVPLENVERAAQILMTLTAYSFDSCYTVGDQNAETMVFRWGSHKPALVASYGWDEESVVFKYTAKYGPRVHHLAFYTPELRQVLTRQKEEGIVFTTEALIGDETRGILQIFSAPSPYSHEITEYVQRFGNFTGFFDKGNVGELMGSTKQFA